MLSAVSQGGLLWRLLPATVVGRSGGVTTVLLDGDDTTLSSAQNLLAPAPIAGDRVIVLVVPPQGNYVIGYYGTPPEVSALRVTSSASQNFPTSGTYAALSFDTLEWDLPGGQWDAGSPTFMTCVRAGVYGASGGISFNANATGRRFLRWVKNGSAINGSVSSMPANTSVQGLASRTIQVELAVGDTLALHGMQESGGALTTLVSPVEFQPSMSVHFIRPL